MPRKPGYDTEARQRKAIRIIRAGHSYICPKLENETILNVIDIRNTKLIATFDLSKFPGMRKGLKGVRKLQKDFRKVTR